MSEDLTDKLPKKDGEILTAIRNLDEHVGKIDTRLASLEQKVDGLEKKFDGLEKKVDERLHDTRPIWHKVVADICELQTGQKRLEQSQLAMRDQISELNSVVRTVNRDQIVINDVVRHIQLDFHTFDERLQRFINKSNQQNSQT
jgi:peptidoglycan hydrolase CwlO-like protein